MASLSWHVSPLSACGDPPDINRSFTDGGKNYVLGEQGTNGVSVLSFISSSVCNVNWNPRWKGEVNWLLLKNTYKSACLSGEADLFSSRVRDVVLLLRTSKPQLHKQMTPSKRLLTDRTMLHSCQTVKFRLFIKFSRERLAHSWAESAAACME